MLVMGSGDVTTLTDDVMAAVMDTRADDEELPVAMEPNPGIP